MIYKIFWVIRALIYKLILGSVGSSSYIGKPTFILNAKKIYLGSKVRIFPGSRIEVHGNGSLHIGNNISIGNQLHVACGGKLTIGPGTLISSFVLITDIDHEYNFFGTPVFDQPIRVKETYIGKNCFIGSGAKILAGTYLADGCVVGANTVVRGSFPERSVIATPRGTIIRKPNQ